MSSERLAEIEARVRLAKDDPGSAGIFYATAEAQIEHEAVLADIPWLLEQLREARKVLMTMQWSGSSRADSGEASGEAG